ncbi:MAG: sodium:proton antiporter [Magnetococcales bacterium]|nr:sodium:proton antiporter [Magnetococcales bacterium]
MVEPFLALALFAVIFWLMFLGRIDRTLLVLAGGGLFVFVGSLLDFYSIQMAWQSVYFETLALIFGLTLISSTLEKSGYFQVLAGRMARFARGDGWLVLVFFSLITYFFSLFINNLATIVVILPITLTLCRRTMINPVPVVIAEVIASNLGGASTMMGDFPNMIISSVGKLHFLDFIGGMMVPSLFLLAAMLLFFQSRKRMIVGQSVKVVAPRDSSSFSTSTVGLLADIQVDQFRLRLGGGTLFFTLCGFLLAEPLDIRPGVVALVSGLFLLMTARFKLRELFVVTGGGDILFFSGLFIMVGGLQGAGVLDGISWLINQVSGGEPVLELLALLWIAGMVTPFLNAGPATAFFIPIAQELSGFIPGETVWWALSLGVLAGSSASLSGATAGSVAASHMDAHLKRYPEVLKLIPRGRRLGFQEYQRWGRPIMGLFLGISSLYLILISP